MKTKSIIITLFFYFGRINQSSNLRYCFHFTQSFSKPNQYWFYTYWFRYNFNYILFYNRWGGIVLRPTVNQILSAGFQNIGILTDSLPAGFYFDFGTGIRKGGYGIKDSLTSQITHSFSQTKSSFIYPNPSSDLFYIPGSGLKKIRLLDLKGKELYSFKTFQNEI